MGAGGTASPPTPAPARPPSRGRRPPPPRSPSWLPPPSAASDCMPPLRRRALGLHGALAAVAYLPLLWSSPGLVSADTKSYLTLDPSRLLAKAPYLWDPTVGMGTVTHQTIGYLWPLGPYYWTM